jgi:hypothetical protein
MHGWSSHGWVSDGVPYDSMHGATQEMCESAATVEGLFRVYHLQVRMSSVAVNIWQRSSLDCRTPRAEIEASTGQASLVNKQKQEQSPSLLGLSATNQ